MPRKRREKKWGRRHREKLLRPEPSPNWPAFAFFLSRLRRRISHFQSFCCVRNRERKKGGDSEPAGKLRKFKKNKNKMCSWVGFFLFVFFWNDKLVVRLYCPLCLKWINRAVSETESQTGNQNRRLQACVASVASGFHTALICFLRLSHKWWWWLWWWCGGKEVGSVAFLRKIVV